MATLWIDAFLLPQTVVLCVTLVFLSFPVHSVSALWMILTKSLMVFFEVSHVTLFPCIHDMGVSADKGMMMAAFDHINQIKESFPVWCEACGTVVQADNSRHAPGLSHACFSWWVQLFNPFPHSGHFRPLHAATAPALSCWCCSAFCHLGQLAALWISVVLHGLQS